MSSQDTLSYAQAEEESAKTLRDEINKEQAEIASLQKEAAKDSSFQQDVDSRVKVVASLQEKERRHSEDAQRLYRQAADERQHEQEEQLRQQQQEKDSLIKKATEISIRRGLF